jgi:hypothetical protein
MAGLQSLFFLGIIVVIMQLNRDIPFTASWKYTLVIALLMSMLLVFIQVFLQPFDTFASEIDLKALKLSGYGLCVFLTVAGFHFLELILYRKRGKKWFLADEFIFLLSGFLAISVLAFLYHSLVFNTAGIDLSYTLKWAAWYALPFAPLLLPFWAYLRYRFSRITIPDQRYSDEQVLIQGRNADERLRIKWSEFILAKSDSNYLDIYIRRKGDSIEKHVFRLTLSTLVDQLPRARQVHRSYLVNTDHISGLSGNTRKGSATVDHYPENVPVSPKHFTALQKHLQSRP